MQSNSVTDVQKFSFSFGFAMISNEPLELGMWNLVLTYEVINISASSVWNRVWKSSGGCRGRLVRGQRYKYGDVLNFEEQIYVRHSDKFFTKLK
jgi:hypothetical protein